MKIPLSWLREYVDFDDDAAGLANKLTFSGIEVEGIDAVRTGLDDVIVAEIIDVREHPGADRLTLCTVNDGTADLQVVCGADNVRAGDKAAFAPCGCKLPSGMKIKKAKVRGEESFGMLCAEDELGLSDDHDGIYLVDSAIKTGTPITDVVGEPDEVLDLEITWNRADCLSILGIAREVAALYGTEVRLPDASLTESGIAASDKVSVEIANPDGCPRYTGRYLSGAKVGMSPAWVQSRLSACGIRPISNLVDITNYVLLETGHPLHAFDYSLVADGGIVVRWAKPGETIRTLDGEERKPASDILLIADSKQPLAVAGVMGGEGSQIQDSTSEVLLESATFDAPSIHRAVSTLGIMSESSHRFERGVDFDWVDFASRRAAKLICELAGAEVASGVVDVHSGIPEPRVIELTRDALNGVIGVNVEPADCIRILTSLQLQVEENETGFMVTVPEFRRDLTREADLIEEVARMIGLDAIPAIMPSCHPTGTLDDDKSWRREEIRDQLVGLGLTETVNYSFLSGKLASLVESDPGVVVPNPVSADYSIMRGSLAPQMIDTLGRNLAHQNPDCACFEIGKVFAGKKSSVSESERICMGLMGRGGRYPLDRMRKLADEEAFLWGKGLLESLVAVNGRAVSLSSCKMAHLAEGAAVEVSVDGKKVGWMGILAESIRADYRMLEPVLLAEIDLACIIDRPAAGREIAPIPTFPAISRDIAIVVKESVLHEQISKVIETVECPELTRIELFDIFRGRGTGDGCKSMAYSLTFQTSNRTLTDEEANGFLDQIRDELVNKLNAEIREG